MDARLVTITSPEEEAFVTSLLQQKARPNKSKALFYWIDGTNAGRGIGFSSNPLGTSTACPTVTRTRTHACPAKVVKHSKRTSKSFWCYFDCNKEFVNAICEVVIQKTGGQTDAGIETSMSSKSDISRRSTSRYEYTTTTASTTASPRTSAILSSLSTSSSASSETGHSSTHLMSDTSTESSSECEVGWRLFADKCYKFIQMDTNGEEAASLCLLHHSAQLAAITSHALQQVIETLVSGQEEPLNRPLLVDGRFDRGSRLFHWSALGQEFHFTNWAPGHPDTRFDCVVMETDSRSGLFGYWRTMDCKQDANLLCR